MRVAIQLWLILLVATLSAAPTTIRQRLYAPDGQVAVGGTLELQVVQAFTAVDGTYVPAQTKVYPISANGWLVVNVVPNTGSAPASWYQAKLTISGSSTSVTVWRVPVSSVPLTIPDVTVGSIDPPTVMIPPSQITAGGATTGQVLQYSGSTWTPYTLSALVDPSTTAGDLLYKDNLGNLSRLGIGSASQVLTVSAGLPIWADPAGTLSVSAVIDSEAIPDGSCVLHSTAVTVPGAALGNNTTIGSLLVWPESVYVHAKVVGPNSVKLEICNHSGASYDPPSTTFYFGVSK
jgi:hypothetical protein